VRTLAQASGQDTARAAVQFALITRLVQPLARSPLQTGLIQVSDPSFAPHGTPQLSRYG